MWQSEDLQLDYSGEASMASDGPDGGGVSCLVTRDHLKVIIQEHALIHVQSRVGKLRRLVRRALSG